MAPFLRNPLPNQADRKRLKAILSRLHQRKEMTYGEAQDELIKTFPDAIKRDPVSPRKLHASIRSLQIAIDDFDLSALDVSKAQGKTTARDLLKALQSIISSLQTFTEELKGSN